MKTKKFVTVLSIVLCFVLMGTLFVGCKPNNDTKDSKTYVGIDINPSINLVVDSDNKVVQVNADNEDAQIMLYGEVLEGKDLDEAVGIITKLAIECKYLTDENSGINVTVAAGNGKADVEAKIGDIINAKINAVAEDGKISVKVNANGNFSLDRKLEYYKKKYPNNQAVQNMTAGKLELVLELQEKDGSLSFEAAVQLDNQAIIDKINEAYAEIEPYATAAYNLIVEEAKEAYDMGKANILGAVLPAAYGKQVGIGIDKETLTKLRYGASYVAYNTGAVTLNYALDNIEQIQSYANYALSNVDTQKIADALGVDKATVDEAIVDKETGKITLDSIDAFIDKQIKNMSQEAYNAIKNNLPELEEYIDGLQAEVDQFIEALPEEYKDQINSIVASMAELGDELGQFVESLGDLTVDDFRSIVTYFEQQRDEALTNMKASVTEEQWAAVEADVAKVEAQFTALETTLNDTISKAMADAKATLEKAKQGRLELNITIK